MSVLQLLAGFIWLLMGGDLLVRASVSLARLVRASPVLIAATVVGFGTSLPELVVSIQASLTGYPNLILGNVVGSNIANVLLVGGASAIVFPLVDRDSGARESIAIMIGALLLFTALVLIGGFSRLGGVALLTGFSIVATTTIRSSLARPDEDAGSPLEWVLGLPSQLWLIALFILLGVGMLPLGAHLLIDSAIEIAATFDVPDTVIGLTVLAVGTSLPELATTVLAAREQRTDVALGAIIGSNTFNVLAIMGTTAVISSSAIPVSSRFMFYDVPVMLVTSGALAFFAWTMRPIRRGLGVWMLVVYVAYVSTLFVLV